MTTQFAPPQEIRLHPFQQEALMEEKLDSAFWLSRRGIGASAFIAGAD